MKKILWFTWDSGTSQTLLPLSDFDRWAEDRKTSYISSIDQEPQQNSKWFSLSRGWTELELAELSNFKGTHFGVLLAVLVAVTMADGENSEALRYLS